MEKKIVYIIDKDEEAKDALEKMLDDHNYIVRCYSDGRRFLNFLQQTASPIRPEFIIIDVLLNGISGFEVVRRFVDLYGPTAVPLLMTSKYRAPEDVVEAQNAGAWACLEKPPSLEHIKKAIKKTKERRTRTGQILTKLATQ